MRISTLVVCLVSALSLIALSVAAQTASPPTSDPQAVALVQKSLAALTNGVSITDVTLTGSANLVAGSDDEKGTAALAAMAAGNSKMSLDLPSGLRTEIRNTSGTPLPGALPPGVPAATAQATQPVGAWSGPDGTLHPIVSHNLMSDPTWFFPAFTLARLVSTNYVLIYIGGDTYDGQQVLHISAFQQFPQASATIASTIQRLSRLDIYFSPSTLLPVALAFVVHPDENTLIDIPTQIQFSSYQAVNGALVPFHVQKYLNYSLVLDLQLTNVTFNSGLSSSGFTL